MRKMGKSGKLKILLVDDSPILLKLGKEIFESGGYEVVAARDGVEALDLLSRHTIAIIITDILMPNMDGYSLCYNVRNNEKYKAVPIIIYSATYISKNDEQLALEIGADMYIRKPAPIKFLLDTTKEVIARPRKDNYNISHQHELSEVKRLYNARFIEKLEFKNQALEEAQRELRKSECRFRALVENISDAISLHDGAGNIFYQSPSMERITGYTQDEAKGKTITDFFHPDDMPAILQQLEKVLKNPGMPIQTIKRVRHKDGHYIWTEGTTTNLLHDDNVRAIVGNFRDISERKFAEEKIERNEKYFRALVENANDLVVLTDKKGEILYVSPAHEKLTGCTTEEITGKLFYTFQHPAHVAELKKQFIELLAHPGVPMQRISRFRRRGGGYIWVEGTVINLLDDENVQGVIGNFHDITERKLVEEKLIHANRLYAFISQINQTIVHVTNKKVLFKEACRIAIDVGKYQMAWIGEVDMVHRKISLVEGAGISAEDCPLFQDVLYDANGPQERAIKTEAYYVCNDVGHDLETVSWKPFAAKYSLKSCMVLPIKKAGIVVATFNLYSSELNLFDEQEINLLQEVVVDISFALDVFDKEKHRKEMEENIIHSELRLKQAQAIAHFGSWELDYVTGIAQWSEEFCRIYGLSPYDSIQTYQSWISFIHPEDIEYTKKVTNEARKASRSFAFHHRIIRKDGAVRNIYSQAEFDFDEDGNPVSLHGVAHDITEMKAAQRSLAQSEANLSQIIDMIPQSIFVKDYHGDFVFVNKNFANLYGFTPKELINKSTRDTIPIKSEGDNFLIEDREMILSGVPKIIPEHPFTDHNGQIHIFHTVKVPFIIPETNEKAVLGISINITEQKKAEAERARIIGDIVQRNNDLEQFSYIISHNLRAPVANILGLVNIMQTIGVDIDEMTKVTGYLAMAAQNLDLVIFDINHILELKNDINRKRETINFEQLLNEVKLSIDNGMINESVNITSDFSAVQEMTSVKSYLYSVFFNLISNSIKYRMPGILAEIEITSKVAGNKIQLYFKDNGLGIDLEKRGDEVFMLYKRFHMHVEGKGMGLFMVKTQVELLGGKITVASEVNKGSAFKIEFEEIGS